MSSRSSRVTPSQRSGSASSGIFWTSPRRGLLADGRLAALASQQDLANSVGSVREVVARILHELRAAALVRTSPGRVEILDPLKLSLELWSRLA